MEAVEFDLPGQEEAHATLTCAVRGEGKYLREIPGSPGYGHIKVVLSPHQGQSGYRFEWQMPEGMLPGYAQSGALAGVKVALLEQLKSERRVVGVCVSVVDGSYHDTDSDERAVAIAARMAVDSALNNATLVES